jgi:TonB-linked SusC/RagA family outer membrane protein
MLKKLQDRTMSCKLVFGLQLIFLLFFMLPTRLHAQEKTINGIILDETGKSLPGASILVKGKTTSVQTDANGKYAIKANTGDILVFSYVGLEKQELLVTSNSATLNVSLKASNALNDIVVVGYGTQRKSDITGASSSVSAKDFKEQPVTSVAQVLQGRAAGVQVTSNSGAPGGNTSIRIRGNNSIQGDNNPLYVIDGFVGADFTTVNPQDIENIEILKDASATAIYGSRGANGVVLISTKKGTAGATQVEFTSRFSSARGIKKLDLLNAADFATTVNANSAATGTTPPFTQAQIDQFSKNGGTDWQDEIFRTAPAKEFQLNLSGGSEKTTYFIGTNLLDQKGVIINSDFKRYALRTNLNSKLSDKFSVHLNLFATRQQGKNLGGNQGRQSPVTQAIAWSPTETVYDSKGGYTLNDPLSSITYNPVAIALDQEQTSINTTANTILGLRYEIVKGLSFDISGAANYVNSQGRSFTGPAISQNTPSASRSSVEGIGLQNTNNLTYTTEFNNDHKLTVTAVYEIQSSTSDGFNASGNNLTYQNLGYYNLNLASTYGVGTNYSNSSLRSQLARINYAYKNKYLVTASVRRDKSSKFQGDNQNSTFPSFGLAWKLSEEEFIKKLNIFDNLKIRGGYGVTGNQAINPYQTLTAYSTVSTSFATGTVTPGIILGNPGNTELKWETTKQTDIGLDVDLFKGRLSFSADYYNKKTSNLLLPVSVPLYLGGGTILSNVGQVNNQGYEFSLSGSPLKIKNFKWTSAFNFSILHNKVVSLANGQNSMLTGSGIGAGLSTQSEFILITGQPLGTYYGLTYLGTWKPSEAATAALYGNVPGDSKYQDLNGDNLINGSDYHAIGNGLPKYSWGWNNTFTYKNLSLNVFVQALTGMDKLDYTYGGGITANSDIRQATIADIKDRYIPGVNETSDIPAFSKTNKTYIVSTRFLENGSFVRLKNISLNYTLPKTLLKKLSITAFVSGTNLITLTKYKGFDPESNSVTSNAGADVNQGIDYGSYPNAKTITGGLTLRF